MAETPAQIRVRFAPSPTGLLHIGGLRTALYNYLFARRHGGSFILRIEDTDQDRFVEAAERDILDSLAWAGIAFDEGPEAGGKHAPYYQSHRAEVYRTHAETLLQAGHAYHAFDTVPELDEMKTRLKTPENPSPRYDAAMRMHMKNALTLSAEEVQRRLDAGEPHVVRLKVPTGKTVRFDDAIRGAVSFRTDELDDQVLLKSDGLPTYHLANVVDDHLMEITHVIRGEEWLSSTPKHMLLYEFFGWEPPQMAHLPLILSPTGGKLSKRNADSLGIPVAVQQYRAAGYEPAALLNFLAFLGWNPGDEREVFTLDELAQEFTLERVGTSGVQFNLDKLKWYNEQHLRKLTPAELADRARPHLEEHNLSADRAYLVQVAELMHDRISFVHDLATEARYFFSDPESYDEQGVKKRWKPGSSALVAAYAERLGKISGPLTAEAAESELRGLADERGEKAGALIHPTRLAVSGVSGGPSLFDMMAVLGKETCIRRLNKAAAALDPTDA